MSAKNRKRSSDESAQVSDAKKTIVDGPGILINLTFSREPEKSVAVVVTLQNALHRGLKKDFEAIFHKVTIIEEIHKGGDYDAVMRLCWASDQSLGFEEEWTEMKEANENLKDLADADFYPPPDMTDLVGTTSHLKIDWIVRAHML